MPRQQHSAALSRQAARWRCIPSARQQCVARRRIVELRFAPQGPTAGRLGGHVALEISVLLSRRAWLRALGRALVCVCTCAGEGVRKARSASRAFGTTSHDHTLVGRGEIDVRRGEEARVKNAESCEAEGKSTLLLEARCSVSGMALRNQSVPRDSCTRGTAGKRAIGFPATSTTFVMGLGRRRQASVKARYDRPR